VDSVRRAKPTMADAGASECWMGAGDYDDGGGGWMGSWVWDRAVEYSGYGCGRRATRQGLSVQVGYFENSGRVCGPGPCPREAPPDLARSGEDAQWERGLRAVSGAARPINAFARREVEPASQPASQPDRASSRSCSGARSAGQGQIHTLWQHLRPSNFAPFFARRDAASPSPSPSQPQLEVTVQRGSVWVVID
jgi:hypothetical protein